jgi:dihydroorotase
VTTREEMEFLAGCRDVASVETTPQHLTLAAPVCYEELGTRAQMNPPIRGEEHRAALWRAVTSGVVDVLGSDHAPHTLEEKSGTYPATPSGMTGVQTLVPVMLDHVHHGRLGLEHFVDLMCASPVRIFGIHGKGRIATGYDADFTVVDLGQEREVRDDWIASRAGWTPYAGRRLRGWPIHTVVRGRVVVREGELQGTPSGEPLSFQETRKIAD